MIRFYRMACGASRFGWLNPKTYVAMMRLWRAERRLMRHANDLAAMIGILDQSPKIRRALRLALRVNGHAAD